MKSKEYRIFTGQHQYEESFSAIEIQELFSISSCHQQQHLLKSEAYNTKTYNSSAKKQRICQKIKNFSYKYSTLFLKTHIHAFSGGFCAQKSVGSFRDLSKLSSTLQHLLTTSD